MSNTHTAAPATGQAQASRLARIRISSLGAVALLVIEFILGIVYNLYGTAPTAKKSIGLFSVSGWQRSQMISAIRTRLTWPR